MSWMLLSGLILVVSSIAMSALLIFAPQSRGSRREQLDVETCKARLEGIEARLKLGELNEAEANAARLALLSKLRSTSWGLNQDLRRAARTLIAPAAVFLLVAGIGAAISYVAEPPEAAGSADTNAVPGLGSDGEMLASLTDYTRSIGAEPASTPADGKLLPDVNTMIERLAARLETTPEDVQGWRTLGWSYSQMERYDQAAAAYAKALELDPSSAELKRSYEEAKAKASDSATSETASSLQTGAVGKDRDGPGVETIAKSEAMPPHEQEAQIRSMVDGLADRLESSPRDVEGWTRLMRSRVVLGEREAAATAFHKALDVFKDDSAASSKITAAAIELELKAE
jgi:cytochrome c-type biogenesis protein CcmH/NrfG